MDRRNAPDFADPYSRVGERRASERGEGMRGLHRTIPAWAQTNPPPQREERRHDDRGYRREGSDYHREGRGPRREERWRDERPRGPLPRPTWDGPTTAADSVPAARPPRAIDIARASGNDEAVAMLSRGSRVSDFVLARRDEREARPLPWVWAPEVSPPAILSRVTDADAEEEERRRPKRPRSPSVEPPPPATVEPTMEPVALQDDASDDSDEEFGPMPLESTNGESSRGVGRTDYGGAMRPGEAEKIAAFVQAGQRVPRRGEVAWSGQQIDHFEKSGYVMSGSRNKRMNEVRMRKENQVMTAEEKKALMSLNLEQEQAREAETMASLRKLIDERAPPE
jgi:hypothetical protein